MAAKQNIFGLIDAGRKVRRPPLVGMQFLHERAMGASDLVGARSGLKAKDLISLLFVISPLGAGRRRPAPLPYYASRLHASGAAGGQDKPSITGGCRRRSRASARPVSAHRGYRARRRHGARQNPATHRAGVVIEFHLHERRAHREGAEISAPAIKARQGAFQPTKPSPSAATGRATHIAPRKKETRQRQHGAATDAAHQRGILLGSGVEKRRQPTTPGQTTRPRRRDMRFSASQAGVGHRRLSSTDHSP